MTDLESHPRSTPEPSRDEPRRRQADDPRTDVELFSAAQQGDGAAFGEFYLRHGTQLYAYFRTRSANPQDAYDLVSETFAQALQSIGDFDADRGEPVGWLYGIAKNKHRRYARRGAIETRGRQRIALNLGPLSPNELDRLEQSIDVSALQSRVASAVTALPESLRDAVRLRCVDGFEYDDVARRLGVRPATARKRVSRGLRQLNLSLADANPFQAHD